jgi:hypothetical protein
MPHHCDLQCWLLPSSFHACLHRQILVDSRPEHFQLCLWDPLVMVLGVAYPLDQKLLLDPSVGDTVGIRTHRDLPCHGRP